MEPYSQEIQNTSFTETEMENTNRLGWLIVSAMEILCSGKEGHRLNIFYFRLGDVTYLKNEGYDDTIR
jgi:hypothetical protein